MAEAAAILSLSAAAVVEDVLRQHGCRLSDRDLASRRAEEAGAVRTPYLRLFSFRFFFFAGLARAGFSEFCCLPRGRQLVGAAARRNEAAGWLRRTVGAVAARDLPEEPSEEEFRLGLRNGQILCGALNRVHPGAVPKASAPCVRYLSRSFPPPLPPLCRDGARCDTLVRAGGREHGGGLRAAGRRRGAVGVPVLRERAQLPGGGAGDRPAVLRGLRFGAGSRRNQWGGAPPLGFACSCSNLSPHPCFLHTLSRVACVTLMCLFAFLGAGREERQGGELRPRTEVVR